VVNGVSRSVEAEPWTPLLDVLRDQLRFTGTKEGCVVGVCGLCSVLVDGELISGCLVPVALVAGSEVTTIEGLAADEELTAIQDAFIRHGGFQCGICTPGQVVAATALLSENGSPSETEIRQWLGGNLCRCTGYQNIVAAVLRAAEIRRERGSAG
jgi:aerobic-type carbon monoxide dehydrogenase small subunit (CoxS/CutS family)